MKMANKFHFILILSIIIYTVNAKHIKQTHHWRKKAFHHKQMTSKQNNKVQQCEKVDFLESFHHKSGYIDIKSKNSTEIKSKYFYVYIHNRYNKPNLPLLLWSNGGPGCSSLEGLFIGSGPYKIQNDLSLCWSDEGWDKYHNILFVDHPLDVGFSHTLINSTINDVQTIGEDMLQFLYSFFELYPELIVNDFYLTGISFAGHYLPSIGDAILRGNKEKKGPYINFKGVEIGNPWMNPSFHGRAMPIYAHEKGLLTEEQAYNISANWPLCDKILRDYCDFTNDTFMTDYCEFYFYQDCYMKLYVPIFEINPDLYDQDIRGSCYNEKCIYQELISKFLNLDDVKLKLNITDGMNWTKCNQEVYSDLFWMSGTDFSLFIERFLEEGLKVSIEVGKYDFLSNWIGNKDWIENLNWPHKEQWNAIEMNKLVINDKFEGNIKSAFNLTFVTINDAAHKIVEDRPDIALPLIIMFTH